MADRTSTADNDAPPRPLFDASTVGWGLGLVLLAAHVPLGLLADQSQPPVATLHAFFTITAAGFVLLTSRRPAAFAGAAAYVTGSEVLWRMNDASVPWEGSKYLVIVLFAVGTIRVAGRRPRALAAPVGYLLLLSPAALVTLEHVGPVAGFERLSFNLAAHVVLAAGVVFFGNIRSDRSGLCGVLWLLVAPILAVNTIATVGVAGLDVGDFSAGNANVEASGGYGPNQVSALIGLALLCCVFLALFERRPQLRVAAIVLGGWFAAQGTLTFSRGGTFNVLVALVAASPFLLSNARTAVWFIGVVALAVLGVSLVLVPAVNDFTGGAFEDRFTSRSTTLRADLAGEELDAFLDRPGVGAGVGLAERDDPFDDRVVASHTEYSRLLGEHGVFGVGAIVLLLAMAVRSVRNQGDLLAKAFAAAAIAWSLAEMTHSATRLAAVGFVFALARLQVWPAIGGPPDPLGGEREGSARTGWRSRRG